MKPKIAIIDDDSSILEAVQLVFELEDFQVRTSMKGASFIPVIEQYKPDVILLDVLLSGEDGRDIAKMLKQKSKTKKIPIIMFSANPNVEESARSAGADDFLSKPFDVGELISKTNNFL